MKDLSMGVFLGEDVTGNQGGTDVLCEPQAPQTRGTADSINGGTYQLCRDWHTRLMRRVPLF